VRRLLWSAGVWGRLTLGLALAATGGVAFGHAWTSEHGHLWWVGAVTLLSGVLLVLSGLYARRQIIRMPAPESLEEDADSEASAPRGLHSVTLDEPLVPLLGALLVYKFQYVTHRELNAALEEQLESGKKQRIGDILVAKGLLSSEQLQEALDLQATYGAHTDAETKEPLSPTGQGDTES
jgi:hypothetical protein